MFDMKKKKRMYISYRKESRYLYEYRTIEKGTRKGKKDGILSIYPYIS